MARTQLFSLGLNFLLPIGVLTGMGGAIACSIIHQSLTMKRIGIIGGGIGGLAAAIDLQREGYQAVIFEKNDLPGGKLSRLRHDGFSFDLGPTVLTMPYVLRELFESCGRSMEQYLTLRPVEPTCRYHWSDGTIFDAFADRQRLRAELLRVFPADARAVEAFLEDSAMLYDATKDIFLFNEFAGAREFLKPRNLGFLSLLPKLGLASTMYGSLRKRFASPKLVQLFARFATYNGSSPYRAPATLNVIPHVEIGEGAWYPEGGMYAIADALARLANELGVELHTGTTVHAVCRRQGRLTAIVAGEREHPVDAVISNADVLWTYRHLLGPAGVPIPRSVERAERSCSGFLMLAAIRGEYSRLAHHNIFFSDDYPEEFRDIFERRRLPRAMTIYISRASASDAALAPPGCESWYMLMNAPASGIDHMDTDAQEEFAASVWQRLERFGLGPEVLWESRLTPSGIESRYNSADGAIYGASSNSIFSAFLRPRNKAPGLDNLYFAGGSTHPGGGVPLALLSGRITARIVRRQIGGYAEER